MRSRIAQLEEDLENAIEKENQLSRVLNQFFADQKQNVDLSGDIEELRATISKQSEIMLKTEELAREKEREVTKFICYCLMNSVSS